MTRKTLLTGLRPTGELHIGNYFGALKPLIELEQTYRAFVMIADLHALTTLEDAKHLTENTRTIAALYIAFGLNPKRATIFVQSRISAHSELATILGMITPLSMVELNPVYKEMLAEHPSKRTFGLLGYPVLQAADIMLYKASAVPVGKDQAPHIELAREIARKFNRVFAPIFPEPKTLLSEGAKILSLADPSKKMSKSHGPASCIGLLDDPKTIEKKIRSAVTDSESRIAYEPEKRPGISNLILLYNLSTGLPIPKIIEKFQGSGYGGFKTELAGILSKNLSQGQNAFRTLMRSPRTIERILSDGEKRARQVAEKTLKETKRAVGLFGA